jgi:hypothetical protein
MLNRAVIQRCVIAGVLTLPGAIFDKHETSNAMTLSSAIIGCVVMLLASLPLVLLTSNVKFVKTVLRPMQIPIWTRLLIPATLSGSAVMIGVIHGFMLAPASFFHLVMLIPLIAFTIIISCQAMEAPLPVTMLIGIDTIAMSSGLLYGAITGSTPFPAMLVAGAGAVACLFMARGMIARLEHSVITSERNRPAWIAALILSNVLMLVASSFAPAIVPMIYPALASCGFASTALVLSMNQGKDTRSRALVKRLISFALFCAVLAVLAGSV